MKQIALLLVAFTISPSSGRAEVPNLPRVLPTEPAHTTETFRTLGGFRMDLLAAEPLVTDPVAMAYDEDGHAFVAEMNDYPYTDPKTHQAWKENTTDAPIGKIRLLIDDNGDGVFDRSTVFADKLSWPTGVACYEGGVYVCATPDLWYFKDTDGDGVADVKRKVFTGFRKFNVQAVSNNLVWGPDNKIYGAGGSNGGTIRPGEQCESRFEPLTLARNDFRFDPATERIELIPGGARFGNEFDDYGNRFVCNIRNPCQHVVIDDLHYLTRNPYVPIASVVHDVAESGDALPVFRASPMEAWRDVRAARFVKEGTKQPRSELTAGGVVTSASGITIYRGDAYPPEFRNMFFLGEVANNLIHRQQLHADGVTFSSKRVDDKSELVASTDVWFRPVNFVNAPDGTLHVLDMYREVIEHPWSIPDDIREKLDLRSGADRGRIYRLAPKDFHAPQPPRLSKASPAELVECLKRPSAWWRETAQRLLVERKDPASIEPLRALVRNSSGPIRSHARWTLEGMAAVTEEDLFAADMDEVAVCIVGRHLQDFPRAKDKLIELANSTTDPRVAFRVALVLGDMPGDDPRVADALAAIVRRHVGDPWVMAAVLSASAERSSAILTELSKDVSFARDEKGWGVLRQLAVISGARNEPDGVRSIIQTAPTPGAQLEIGVGFGEGLRRRPKRMTLRDVVQNGEDSNPLVDMLASANRLASDSSEPLDLRVRAVRFLGFDDLGKTKALFTKLLDPRQPPEVQRAVIAAVSGINTKEVGPMLLARWRSYTPGLKAEVIQAMLGYANRLPPLLDALEAGTVSANDVPAARRPALVNHADPAIRARAAQLFATPTTQAARKDVIERFTAALELKGNAEAGRAVFESTCATCHRLGDKGADVGPNLATVRQWSGEQLLTNILDPNREVAPAFVEYVVQLNDGETLAGVVAEETGNSLTLKLPGGTTRVLPRQSVKRIAASKLSLMPEGLESTMTPQQLADLIALLRGQ